MKNLKKVVLTGIVGLISATSFGQLTMTGEIRPRAEYRNGYKSTIDSSQTNAFFVDQRTRINLDYVHADYQFYVSLQDIRVWGATKQLNSNDGFLAVHQAWAKANINKNWGLKVGRQEIIYDDHRIFGNVGWAQQARSHDAAIMQYKKENAKFDFGLAFNQATNNQLTGTDYTGPTTQYRDMYFARYNNKFGDKIDLSVLALMTGRQVDHTVGLNEYKSMNYIATLGTHTKFDFGKFKLNFNGYFQMGSDIMDFTTVDPDPLLNSTTAVDRSAYLVGIDASYKVTKEFSVGFGYETQSGNSPSDTTDGYWATNRSFNPLFGTNHKFNGFMDYFYVGSGHGNVGLQDAFLKLKYKKAKWTFGLDAHMFMTGFGVEVLDNDTYNSELIKAQISDPTATLDPFDYKYASNLGTEIDLSIATKLNKSVTVKAGYSMMLASDLMYNLKGDARYNIDAVSGEMNAIDVPMNTWGYVMLIFKPTFLKSK